MKNTLLIDDELKYNPRLLEVRLTIIYDKLYKEFGGMIAYDIIMGLCKAFSVDEECITGVINNFTKIKRLKIYDPIQWNRLVMFVCHLWGEKKLYVGRVYLMNMRGMYTDYYNEMMTEQDIENMKNQVVYLDTSYKINNVRNFLDNLHTLRGIYS